MTQEDKELLLKDLSARLPYHVRVKVWLKDKTTEEGVLDLKHNYGDVLRDAFYCKKIIDIKPYLRPMSSMTEEEAKDYIRCKYSSGKVIELRQENGCNISTNIKLMWLDVFDFLNAHHFDYRGLIEKGLALEAPKGMY